MLQRTSTPLTHEGRKLSGGAGSSEDDAAHSFWRSLDAWAEGGALPAEVGEFAPGADLPPTGLSRRRFVQLMGASLALAHMTGCSRQPEEHIVPYVEQPEQLVPGQPRVYATATMRQGYAIGTLVTTYEGRPTKVEPNPSHPASGGADAGVPGGGGTDVFTQAAVLSLYDPDRSRAVRHLGEVTSWPAFQRAWSRRKAALDAEAGAGLALVTANFTGPTMFAQIRRLLERWPNAIWVVHEPAGRAHPAMPQPRFRLDHAAVIASFDDDLLYGHPAAVRYAADFAAGRRVRRDQPAMNRLYTAAAMPSVTTAQADHHLPVRAGEVEPLLSEVAKHLDIPAPVASTEAVAALSAEQRAWAAEVAADLRGQAPRVLVTVGPTQHAAVQHLVRRINVALGAEGEAVTYHAPFDALGDERASTMADLCTRIDNGGVQTLVIAEANPVYDGPADLGFSDRMRGVAWRAHLGTHVDETAQLCDWHVPASHEMEHWNDARAFDGSPCIAQPLIRPLYGGRSTMELLASLLDDAPDDGLTLIQSHWRDQTGVQDEDFALWWRRTLHDGTIKSGRSPGERVGVDRHEADPNRSAATREPIGSEQGWEVRFESDPRVGDGRWANNAWLQELPKPITKLVWGNAVLMSPASADRLGVGDGDVVSLSDGERRIEGPVWRVPGHADGCVTLRLGYGRTAAGAVGNGVGFSAAALRTTSSPWRIGSARVEKTGRRKHLVTTQHHQQMEGRDLVRGATLDAFRADPHAAAGPGPGDPDATLLSPWRYDGYKWGMVIDLTTCIGCGVCTIACQAENNIPVVGAEEVDRLREMHWIRVDRYFEGDPANPRVVQQPVPCMHCEHAPCEVVCPTGATQHSSEGLNEMIYNRCVGTRYCSNNCPYKVRRFNFFDYTPDRQPVQRMQHNPNVTVRSRGVMEKCSYCVQRIEAARIDASARNATIGGDEVVTACQSACPTQAILFGDLNQDSRVAAAAAEPHDYGLLAHLNTRPRTTYLAAIGNPNRRIEPRHGRSPDGR